MQNIASHFQAQLRRSRIVLMVLMLPLAVTSGGLFDYVQPVLRLVYMILGFSLIIFLHELGHFVVARACSVKCLAFSIGIGPRMLGWRKGGKLSFGADPYDQETLKGKSQTTALETATPENAETHPVHHQASAVQSDLPTTATIPPHSKAVGDCDYRVSWLPLGGYVRMLGQDDLDPTKISTDPHAFNRRPVWQRMCIVSAGVIMNLIFAAVTFSIIFSPGIGVGFPPAVIGATQFGMPAWDKLKMGDRVLMIDNQPPVGFLEFTDLQMRAALWNGSGDVDLLVQHRDGTKEHVMLSPKFQAGSGLQAFGVESIAGTKIADEGKDYVDPDSVKYAKLGDPVYEKNVKEYAKIVKGDKIVKINDTPLVEDDKKEDGPYPYLTLVDVIDKAGGQPVTLTLENTKDTSLPPHTITLFPKLDRVTGVPEYPTVMGLTPSVVVGEPNPKSPAAAAKFKEGDRVLRVGDTSSPTVQKMIEIIKNETNGKPISITVERATAAATMPTVPASPDAPVNVVAAPTQTIQISVVPTVESGKGLIGLPLSQDLASTKFVAPVENGAVSALAQDPAAFITAIDGKPVATWQDIYGQLRTKPADASVKVTFNDGHGKTVNQALVLSKEDHDAVTGLLKYQLGLHLELENRIQRGNNTREAVMLGMDHTKKFILNVYMTLAGLFRRTVSPDNLHGIVGITKVGYDVQERGPVWLWYVLAMVSVNLAVANFLPLPIVDGGLFLLLILEKVRGKPLSMKVQTAIQAVGIVLLAGLFLFVTFNDLKMFVK